MNTSHEFKVVTDLYEEDKEGKEQLVKKNIVTKWLCDDISSVEIEQHFDDKGRIKKGQCRVHHKTRPITLVVKDDYYKLKRLKQRIVNEKSIIGFKSKGNG
jgi:hypothetical protein